jgi:glycosyltransferase involved in cell wall biosynthesis
VPDELKILHVVSAPAAGGIEVYSKQLAAEFRRLGHRPVMAFVGHAADHGRSQEFEDQYLRELDAAGVDYFFIGDSSRRFPPIGAWRIWRYCRSNAIDIYHSHLVLGILFGFLLRIPRFHSHHSSVIRLPSWGYRLLNPLVDHYIAISRACADLLERSTGRRVAMIRNGIDIARFAGRVRRGSKAIVQCICVGRIVEAKNYPLLLESIALARDSGSDTFRVKIVGEGQAQLVARLEREIRERGLASRVELLGNRVDVPELLGQSDLFVMSSAWEGLPISLIEATASGLPFIATDVGGCRELAYLCGNGVIVPPGDAQALAGALAALVEDCGRRAALSEAALANAGKLSIEAAADEHLRLYAAAMADGRDAAADPSACG